jgi:hypothetical protein
MCYIHSLSTPVKTRNSAMLHEAQKFRPFRLDDDWQQIITFEESVVHRENK